MQLNLNEAILTCRSSRYVQVEYRTIRGEFEKFFPSILSAKAWCADNNLKIV